MARIAVVAWSRLTQRASELAEALGGESVQLDGFGMVGAVTAPVRYLINSVRTALWLARRRPVVLVVQNPPIVLPILALAYTRLTRGTLVLDSHPLSFGRKGHRFWRAMVPLHRWVARRAALVLVTVEELAAEARAWGVPALVVHEAPPNGLAEMTPREGTETSVDFSALFVGVFGGDEPVEEVVAAARLVPEARIDITGDIGRAPAGLIEAAPPNAVFVGYLKQPEYQQALRETNVVLALTTEPTSVVRAAYEAVYARRPLIVSDWPHLRDLFPSAVPVQNTAAGIAAGVRSALASQRDLELAAETANAVQQERWTRQLAALRRAVLSALTNPDTRVG